eukprot:3128462-Amphidinium_carterae.1
MLMSDTVKWIARNILFSLRGHLARYVHRVGARDKEYLLSEPPGRKLTNMLRLPNLEPNGHHESMTLQCLKLYRHAPMPAMHCHVLQLLTYGRLWEVAWQRPATVTLRWSIGGNHR